MKQQNHYRESMKFCYKYVMVIKLRKWKCKRIALKSKPFKHEPWLMEEIQ